MGSHFMMQKTPECSVTNHPSIIMVGYTTLIQNYFSGYRLKIKVAFGGPTTLLSLGHHPLKLTLANSSMVTTGHTAGLDKLWVFGSI